MELNIWYAVNKGGQGRVFLGRPKRDEKSGLWLGETTGDINLIIYRLWAMHGGAPALSWEDEPLELQLTLGYV